MVSEASVVLEKDQLSLSLFLHNIKRIRLTSEFPNGHPDVTPISHLHHADTHEHGHYGPVLPSDGVQPIYQSPGERRSAPRSRTGSLPQRHCGLGEKSGETEVKDRQERCLVTSGTTPRLSLRVRSGLGDAALRCL